MFYPVKIKDGKGKVKKVLSSKKLSDKYWDSYFGGLKKRVPLHLRKKAQKDKDLLDTNGETDEESLG